MLSQKIFWALNLLFLSFAALITWGVFSIYQHNENMVANMALEAQNETFEYITKELRKNDVSKIKKELKEHGWTLSCISENCDVPSGYQFFKEIEQDENEIFIYKNLVGDIYAIFKYEQIKIGAELTHKGKTKQILAVTEFSVLFFLTLCVYLLAIFNLRQNVKIKTMLNDQEETLNAISHEIKTPLAKAKLALEFINDSDKKTIIKKALKSIDELSGDILQSKSLIGESKSTIKASDIAFLAKEKLFNDERIDVLVEGDFYLKVNPDALSVAIKNLMTNALAHSQDNACKVIIKNKKISVTSKGEPISSPIEELCSAFKKGDKSKGFGLGLYIVSHIVKNANLKLSLTREADKNVFSIG